jgi:tRNA-splicing ligase RtcB
MLQPTPAPAPSPTPARDALRRVGEVVYEIPASFRADMRVPARVFADEVLIEQIRRDRSLEQLVNVATLPGVVEAVYGMPDMHEGYGFPVGGVAATAVETGVISPGGIGFDINCGVRLLVSQLEQAELAPALETLVHEISRSIPTGYGRSARGAPLSDDELHQVLGRGVPYLVRELGWGTEEDIAATESQGALPGADPGALSVRAKERGAPQLGTLGGGNHFLEVQVVDEVFDGPAAERFGLKEGRVMVLVHTGSAPTTSASWTPRWPGTASRCPTGSSRARPSRRRRAGATSRRWRRRRTSASATAR